MWRGRKIMVFYPENGVSDDAEDARWTTQEGENVGCVRDSRVTSTTRRPA